ncbi:MAG: glycosyltransferase family A protein [Candidatus Neomarinimicrobiota bacterium]
METAIILHLPDKQSQTPEVFNQTLQSIFNQTNEFSTIIALAGENSLELPEEFESRVKLIPAEVDNLSYKLNLALEEYDSDFLVYVDNQVNPVFLKQACLDMFLLAARRNPKIGLIYADYELQDGDQIKEVHLFSHHAGRLRDNQDYGKVFFFDREALDQVNGFDESLDYNALYDIRLKLAARSGLIRISNKYNGSLYRILAAGKSANVFDYLLAGKEVQLEAEAVVTEHLKRIGAYLRPSTGYFSRSKADDAAPLLASVIIPVNNRPEFMSTAIASIQAQTVSQIEAIIVVNGGPDDPTIPEVQRYLEGGDKYEPDKPQIKLVVIDINNIGFCLNMGVRHASGQYYVQLDSDDRLKPNAIEKILEVYESDLRIGMVIGSYEVWEKQESGELRRMEEIPIVTHDEWTEKNGRNNLLRINGAGAPRSIPFSVIRDMGYFGINDDPFARNYGEDYDMVLHISEKYRIGRIYEPIYEVIRHSGGTDHSIDQSTVDRNDEAKDWMRLEAIRRRQHQNRNR